MRCTRDTARTTLLSVLAPGILALAAILAIVATYYHPALEQRR
jgi:hypothetical protein